MLRLVYDSQLKRIVYLKLYKGEAKNKHSAKLLSANLNSNILLVISSSSFLFFGDRKDKTKINIEEIVNFYIYVIKFKPIFFLNKLTFLVIQITILAHCNRDCLLTSMWSLYFLLTLPCIEQIKL